MTNPYRARKQRRAAVRGTLRQTLRLGLLGGFIFATVFVTCWALGTGGLLTQAALHAFEDYQPGQEPPASITTTHHGDLSAR